MKRTLADSENELPVCTGDAQDGTAPAPLKGTKKAKRDDHDFSGQEISRLQETEALFHSSLFRLAVSELLKEVSVKLKLKIRIEKAYKKLSNIIQTLPAGEVHKLTDRSWLTATGVKIPFIEKPAHVKGVFQFLPPTSVRLSGSYVTDTLVKPHVSADLVLEIPKESFNPKDFLNQRYIRKRALYLAALATYLYERDVQDLKFTYLNQNPQKPVLLVNLKGDDSKSVQLCLHAVPEKETFKLSRFHVSKNNVRPKWFFNGGSTEAEEENDPTSLPATPFYNSNILHDLCMSANDQFVAKMLQGSEGLSQGIILMKVWLRQREILQGFGAFSSYLLTAYVVFLLINKKLSKIMNSYQVMRTTLTNLSRADWTSDPPSLFEDKPDKSHPSVDEFRDSGLGCVFIDRTGYLNMAYMLTPAIFARVRHEAGLAIKTLDQRHQNSFDVLFMTPVSFARKFDHIFHVYLTSELLESCAENNTNLFQRRMDVGDHLGLLLSEQVQSILSKALGKRTILVQSLVKQPSQWGIQQEPLALTDGSYLTFGLALDCSSAFNILDKGPPADSAEAKEFRDFWGEKSEMRRFKDGSIHEAVLWTSSECQSDRRLVCKRIVQYVLQRHCGLPRSCLQYMAGKLDPLLHVNLVPKDDNVAYGTGEEQSLAIIRSYDQLTQTVRSLTSLPLGIHSIQGIHPVFRHSDVFPALPALPVLPEENGVVVSGHVVPESGKPLPPFIPALSVICMLESSGKWPEDVEAINCLKTLLHIKMGKELQEKHLLPVSIHKSHIDVVKDGFVFRLKIANTRELAVLRTVKTDSGLVKFRETEESTKLEKEIIALPLLTNLLHGLQQEHPVYSATVRLCKRWVASQMVWKLIREETVELMVAYLFICPYPYTPPGEASVGLMRFFHLLVTFNWKADPLMVNLNKDFTEADFTEIPKEFTKNRTTLPSMCIPTPQDKSGTKWTRQTPSEAHLQRLVLLAEKSLSILESSVMKQTSSSDLKVIFRPPLEHFDVLIHLQKKANVLDHLAVDGKNEILRHSSGISKGKQPIPVIDFNVVQKFLTDLQNIFGEVAMFFHDPFGGSVIGMVWRAQAAARKDFKTSLLSHRKPTVGDNEVLGLELDKDAVLDDIKVLGGGIVQSVEQLAR